MAYRNRDARQVICWSLLLFSMGYAQAEQITLAWEPYTEPNLSGYQLHCGAASGTYTTDVDVGNQTTYTVEGLQQGKTYYCVVQAYGNDDNDVLIQSGFSNEASEIIPYSLWATETTPGISAEVDNRAVELGVRFQTDVDGFITGIRFYKDAANTGPHIGSLWLSDGTLLAKATFANETASGWQRVNFSKPVAIKANTVYVASYYTSTGHYYASENTFSAQSVDAPPLHAVADRVTERNGVYRYSEYSRFPNNSYHSSNYWVDVMFSTQ